MNGKDLIQPIQLLIYASILLISVGVCYATIVQRLSSAEEKINATKSDHDLIVTIATKISTIEIDIKELKSDMKTLYKEIIRP
jgi:hypothetical protein